MIMRRLFSLICILLCSTAAFKAVQHPVPESLPDLARLRVDSNPARLEAVKEILRERGIPFELQTFQSKSTPHGRTRGTNVIISFGTGNKEITVGAHYDALELYDGRMIEGMIDNGAGAIILMRVAGKLVGKSLNHRVRIVLFDMEEEGLIGSRAYVAAYKSDIAAAVNLDVTGLGDSLAYHLGKTDGIAVIHTAVERTCIDMRLSCIEFPLFPQGDDRSFQGAHIPVISIAMGPRPEIHQAWLYLNGGENSGLREGFIPPLMKMIHTNEDTIDKIKPESVDLGVQLILNLILKLDEAIK